MRLVLIALLMFALAGLGALEVTAFGPEVSALHFGNFNTEPISFGGNLDGNEWLYLEQNGTWTNYSPWVQGLAAEGSCMLSEELLMVAFGGGTYSDGVYNFDLNTHQWSINEWFFWPNFIKHVPGNNTFYVGERDGLFHSDNGGSWTRIVALGTAECSSLDSYTTHIVANCGNNVYYSSNLGQSWQVSDIGNLKSFRFSSSGILYAIMDNGSDSDGVWRSDDFGATWVAVYYGSGISCIGPDYQGYLCLGWNVPNEFGSYVSLLTPQQTLFHLNHPSLNSPVKQMDIFPLINTPSFFVINSTGCHYLTGFLPTGVNDPSTPQAPQASLQIYPNPFRESACISYKADAGQAQRVNIYNLKGQRLQSLDCGQVNPDRALKWNGKLADGTSVPSGIYFVELVNDKGQRLASTKAMLLR